MLKTLGVIMEPSISLHKHCNYVSDRIDKTPHMLKALAGSSWGQDKETLLMTYSALALHTVVKGFNQMAPSARTITVALDMSKAFDTINIHTLIFFFFFASSN